MHMGKRILGYALVALCLCMAAPALAEGLSSGEERRLEEGIRSEVQREIAPWRANHSKGGMNLDARFGTPEWSFSFEPGTCSVTLTFPKGPMEWKEVSRFQLAAAQKILNVFSREGVQLDTLTFKLYSRQGKKLEGVATTSSSDDKIRWKPK